MYVAKTKALISFAVTAKLICVFVFAYAKRWFSHDAAHIVTQKILLSMLQKSKALISLRERAAYLCLCFFRIRVCKSRFSHDTAHDTSQLHFNYTPGIRSI